MNLKKEKKNHQNYCFNGFQVYIHTFCLAHGMERKQMQAIAASLGNDGLVPSVKTSKKTAKAFFNI